MIDWLKINASYGDTTVHEAGVLVFGNLLEGYQRVAARSPCRASISLMRRGWARRQTACVSASRLRSTRTHPVRTSARCSWSRPRSRAKCSVDGSIVGAEQAVSLTEALRAVTSHAAGQIGMADGLGTLEAGKLADLTILEKDPYTVDRDALMAINVSQTWVGGRKMFG
ncbi:MAG: amidohydrolase family protein [Acidimicrobiales bacterium]